MKCKYPRHHLQFISHCYKPETPAFPMCYPTCEPDVAALANRSSTTPSSLVLTKWAGVQNNDLKSDLRVEKWMPAMCNI